MTEKSWGVNEGKEFMIRCEWLKRVGTGVNEKNWGVKRVYKEFKPDWSLKRIDRTVSMLSVKRKESC